MSVAARLPWKIYNEFSNPLDFSGVKTFIAGGDVVFETEYPNSAALMHTIEQTPRLATRRFSPVKLTTIITSGVSRMMFGHLNVYS